ncbi:hypothetical protein QFC19_003737 [Naganishia cerealis]|uniref:Uncharacterized protein n=1 Tax=Naganishia cerealis TaxID=610337 RepID=A0ACC2W2R9_9TREE|nr:hypothetical protein QFC19_003737 [Naganishia cerealis]
MPFNAPLKKSTPAASRRSSSPTAPYPPAAPQPQRNISDLSAISSTSTCSASTSASETSSLEAAPIRPPVGQGGGTADVGASGYGHGYAYGHRYGFGYGSRPMSGYGDHAGRYQDGDDPRGFMRGAHEGDSSLTTRPASTPADPSSHRDDSTASSTTFVQQRLSAYNLHSPTHQSFSFSQPGSRESSTSRSPVTPRAARLSHTSPGPPTGPARYHTYAQPYPPHATTAVSGPGGIGISADPEAQHLLMGELRPSSSGPDLAELRRRAAKGRRSSLGGQAGAAAFATEGEEGESDLEGRKATLRIDTEGRQGRKSKQGVMSTTENKGHHRNGTASQRPRSQSSAASVSSLVPSPRLFVSSPSSRHDGPLDSTASAPRESGPSAGGVSASPSSSARLEPRKAVGLQDFLFGEVIGRGSYSTVILATQKATSIPYAIKILDQYQLVQEKKTKYAKVERDALVRLGPMAVHPTAIRATHHGMGVHPNGVASARASRRGSEASDAGVASKGTGEQGNAVAGGLGGAVNSQLSRLTNTSSTRVGQSSSMPGWKRSQPPPPPPPPPAPPAEARVTRQRSVSGATLTPDDVGRSGTGSRDPSGTGKVTTNTGNPNLVIHIPETTSSHFAARSRTEEGGRGSAGDRLTVPLSPIGNSMGSPKTGSRETGAVMEERENGRMSSSQATIVPSDPRGSISPISRVGSPNVAPPLDGVLRPSQAMNDGGHTSGGSGSGTARKQKKRPRSAHPGVVRLHYTFKDDTSLYFVLDLAINGELLSVIKKYGSFDVDSAKRYAAQLIDTIEFMHERGVIHRDLKPENILLDEDMRIKVTDFGSAKVLELSELSINKGMQNGKSPNGSEKDGVQETQRKRSFVGTAEYVSPEVLRNEHASFAADIWAFGCILFQMLAGRPPFRGATEYLTFQQVLKAEYEFPEGFDEQAKALIQQLLKLDPAERLDVEKIKAHPYFDGVDYGRIWTDYMPDIHTGIQPPAQTTTMQFAWDDLIAGKADSSESGMQSASNKDSGASVSHDEDQVHDNEDLEAPRRRWIEHGGGIGTFSSGSGTTDDGVTLVGGSGQVRRVNTSEGDRKSTKDSVDKSMLPHRRTSLQWSPEERRNKWSEHLVQGEEIVYQSAILLRSGLLLPKRRTLVLTSLPRLICVKENPTNGSIKIQAECLFEQSTALAHGHQGDGQEDEKSDMAMKRMVKKVFAKGPRAFVVKTSEKERVFITDREDIRARWMEELDKVKPKENE